jgi:hypothetical protein
MSIKIDLYDWAWKIAPNLFISDNVNLGYVSRATDADLEFVYTALAQAVPVCYTTAMYEYVRRERGLLNTPEERAAHLLSKAKDFALDLPFNTMFFYYDDPQISLAKFSAGKEVRVHGVLVTEVIEEGELTYGLMLFSSYGDDGDKPIPVVYWARLNEANWAEMKKYIGGPGAPKGHSSLEFAMHTKISEFLYYFHHREVAVGREKHSRSYSGVGSQGQVNISNWVRVTPRADAERSGTGPRRNIEWSHSWWVAGHWRKHEGLGKDRAGNRTVEGRTWVVAHTKGEGPELLKGRKVTI